MKSDGTLHYRRILTAEFLTSHMAAGAKVAEIATEVGCSTVAVYDALRRHGLPGWGQSREPRPDWTDVLTEAFLAEAYIEEGRTMVSIAAEVGCSPTSVLRALRRHGLVARPPAKGGPVIYDVPTDAGRDIDVAEQVGTVRSTVVRARRRAGAKRPIHAPAMSDDVLAGIDARLQAGERLADLAQAANVSYRALWSRLDRWQRRRRID